MAAKKVGTPFTKANAAENGRKGGVNSGKKRAELSDIRALAKKIANGTYTDRDGKKMSGIQLVVLTQFRKAIDENDKQCCVAFKNFMDMLGYMPEEQKQKFEKEMQMKDAEIELLKKRAESMEEWQ